MPHDELSPEAQEAIAKIAANQRPAPDEPPVTLSLFAEMALTLSCDRCPLVWLDSSGGKHAGSRTTLIDNAKSVGWVERRRHDAVRYYCPTCAAEIAEREGARRRPGRRTR